MQFYLAVKAIIRNQEGKILVMKRSDKDDHLPGVWETPGGGIDHEEAPQKALEREVMEETGLAIVVKEPFNVFTFRKDTGEFKVGITFLCDINEGEVRLSDEHSEYAWIYPEEFTQLSSVESLYKEISDYSKKYAKQ